MDGVVRSSGRNHPVSRENVLEKRGEDGFAPLFSVAADIISRIEPSVFVEKQILTRRYRELCDSFAADCRRVEAVADILTGEEAANYGGRVAETFSRWNEEGGCPSIIALVAHAIGHFGLDPADPLCRAAFVAAVLAEVPNGLQYHGNEHYRKVLFHTIRLAALHNQLSGDRRQVASFDGRKLGLILTAACIHDLGHEGGDNLRDGIYTPGAMEQRAIDIARPYLEAAGLDRDTIGEIETCVFCTDITFFAGDNSPCVRMKKIFRHYFWEGYDEDVSMMMMGKLRRFEDNPDLAYIAMLLHEADIGSSAGLSYEQTMKETIAIMEERGVKTAGPKTVLAFLREQLGETLFTEPGKILFGKVMADVIRQAEDDLKNGRDSFYR